MFGCAQQGSGSPPLALSITQPDALGIPVPPGSSGATSGAGEIGSVATATGGDGTYTYAWSIAEVEDTDGAFSVASQGTTGPNNSTYDDATVSVSYNNPLPPTPPPEPPSPATYKVSCTVTDGNGDTASASQNFTIEVAL